MVRFTFHKNDKVCILGNGVPEWARPGPGLGLHPRSQHMDIRGQTLYDFSSFNFVKMRFMALNVVIPAECSM